MCRSPKLRGAAADLIDECGPYARMAALFLAKEAREDGDTTNVIYWTRVANAIVEMEARLAQRPTGLH